MIESLVDLSEMERKPALALVWAVIVSSVAVIVASQVQSIPGVDFGFFAVVFTIIPSVTFLTLLIRREERREEREALAGKGSFWAVHGKDIAILLLYFFGLSLSFSLWSFLLPPGSFEVQLDKINAIRGTGALTQEGAFFSILDNNLQVMGVSFMFSLIFGAGAIFIIVWNASVLGVFVGQFSQSLWHIPVVSAGFLPHGIPEIGGYLAAGLAGGILSAAVLRRRQGVFEHILVDSLKLLALGALLIVLGAAVEVYL